MLPTFLIFFVISVFHFFLFRFLDTRLENFEFFWTSCKNSVPSPASSPTSPNTTSFFQVNDDEDPYNSPFKTERGRGFDIKEKKIDFVTKNDMFSKVKKEKINYRDPYQDDDDFAPTGIDGNKLKTVLFSDTVIETVEIEKVSKITKKNVNPFLVEKKNEKEKTWSVFPGTEERETDMDIEMDRREAESNRVVTERNSNSYSNSNNSNSKHQNYNQNDNNTNDNGGSKNKNDKDKNNDNISTNNEVSHDKISKTAPLVNPFRKKEK